MKETLLLFPIIIALFFGSFLIPLSFAQFEAGGVDKEGSWYAGEGLKQGDFFSYSMCHVYYKECVELGFDMWIKGEKQVGSETKWLAEVVVYDGDKIVKGTMELGKVAPEPTGSSSGLGSYVAAFKSSIVWLSAFATADTDLGGKGPKEFSAVSWGKIGNIGGQQVRPTAIETITVPAGTWETVQISWHTGGATSKVWIVDDFPFPIKAKTFTHVSSGIPPTEYMFTLLDYEENVQQSPFQGIESTENTFIAKGCDTTENEVSIEETTKNFGYQIHAFYSPPDPTKGCKMHWLINFLKYSDENDFLNQVQYDFLVVDDQGTPLRSIAYEKGREYLYSPSGSSLLDFIVKEDPGTANYVIWIYGLAPEGIVPSTAADYVEIPVQIYPGQESSVPITPTIPSWVKNNAGWWADGLIDDASFINGIQFLIEQGIMKIS